MLAATPTKLMIAHLNLCDKLFFKNLTFWATLKDTLVSCRKNQFFLKKIYHIDSDAQSST